MTIDEMKAFKTANGLSYKAMSESSGVPASTIFKIFNGRSKMPRKRTLDEICSGIEKMASRTEAEAGLQTPGSASRYSDYFSNDSADGFPGILSKAPANGSSMGPQMNYSSIRKYEFGKEFDELINGRVLEAEFPAFAHQVCAGFLYSRIARAIEESGTDWEPFIAPVNVFLAARGDTFRNDPGNEKTSEESVIYGKAVVHPDVGIICDLSAITAKAGIAEDAARQGIHTAPDFVAEILSPSTRSKDLNLKGWIYAEAGVKLYWMIDPDREQVIVHDYEHGDALSIHTFDETIGLNLRDERLTVDFSILKEELARIRQQLYPNEKRRSGR